MLSYTARRNLAGSLCNNSSVETLALFDSLMNSAEKRIISAKDWPFLWKQYILTTVASQQAYTLPPYTQTPQSVYITVGSYRYQPKEISTRTAWDRLNQVSVTSDIPQYYFIYDSQILFFPTPASAGNTITFNARRIAKDLTIADYTTATITSITLGGTTVTGSGTSWTAQMAGRFIRINDSDTANTGDGFWYEIASVASATSLTLTRNYGGTSISGGSATYTIGQCSLIPEPHNQLPIFEALKLYFTSTDPNPAKAKMYAEMAKDSYDMMFRDYTSKADVVLDNGRGYPSRNWNIYRT